uniref:NAD-specific glutamate dehydrogenase n=1 Tax=Siphoviridae sp. ctBLh2 TaxID=2827803 RepID=A0A8S5S3D0_9CAUD|nr:MAG TPA: hypothetical protein [Siphoviridae sp. ctBLh2]
MDLAHHAVEVRTELLDVRALEGREEDARRIGPGDPALPKVVERAVFARRRSQVILLLFNIGIGIDLVEDQIDRFVAGTNLLQGLLDHGDLVLELRMGDVHDMHQQVGLTHLVERRFERLDEFRRELADETDGVRQQEREVVEDDLAHRGVERREKFVLGKDLALGDEVHERRFAHVRIADERHTNHGTAVRALHGHLAVDLLEVLLEFGNAIADDAPVGLDLAFARTAAGSRTAALPLEVGPQTRQPGQHVFVVGQLHLRLGIGRLGPRHEDVEDQARAVQQTAGHLLLDVARLRRGEFVVKDHHVDLLFTAIVGNLLQFARTDIDPCRRLCKALRETLDGDDVGRLGQKLQLVEILLGLAGILVVANDGNEHGTLLPVGRLRGRRGIFTVLFRNILLIHTVLQIRKGVLQKCGGKRFRPATSARCTGKVRHRTPRNPDRLRSVRCTNKGIRPKAGYPQIFRYGILVRHAEVYRQGVLHTHGLVTLLARAPLRRLVQHADGLLRKRTVGSLQHLDVGQTAVLLDHEGQHHATLNTVLEGDLREADVLLYPVAERIQVTALERGHRLGDQERLVVLDLLLLNLYLLDHLGILVELGEADIRRNLRVVGHHLDQVGDHLHLDLLGLLGRLLVLTGDLRDLLLDDGRLQVEFLNFALLGRIPERNDHECERYDKPDFEQKTPLVLKVRFG